MLRTSTTPQIQAGILACTLTMSLGAQSAWKNLDGKAVPQVAAAAWLNTKGAQPTSTTLRGKVWLIEFFATW